MLRETIVEGGDDRPKVRNRPRRPARAMRRVYVYLPEPLWQRLLTAAWLRKQRKPSEAYSAGAVVREVLEAVLPPAIPGLNDKK